MINQIIEDSSGKYIMAGRYLDSETSNFRGYILEIDDTGNLLQTEIINPSDTTSSYFYDIHFFNDYFYIIGSVLLENPNITKLWFMKLNSNLEIVDELFLNIPNGKWFSYMKSIIDSDTNLVITGYTSRFDTSSSTPINNDPFFYKLSLDGDSLNSKFMSISFSSLSMSTEIIEKANKSGYFAYGNNFTSQLPLFGQRFELSKSFDSLSIENVPYFLYGYFSAKHLNDTSIIVCGQGGPPDTIPDYSLNVLSQTENNTPINYNYFKKSGNVREYPALCNSIDKHNNNIYVGGTSNFDYSNPFFSTLDSWFHLIKINPDLSPIWEYWYGGNAYYNLYSVLATSDGGCIMVGNRYDYETQDQERDIYIVKVDSNGLLTWSQEILFNKTESTVYPNPGTDQLNIKTTINYTYFELINLNGQVVIRQNPDNNLSTINTKSLKSGMYFYRLIDKTNKTIETGKWIKK